MLRLIVAAFCALVVVSPRADAESPGIAIAAARKSVVQVKATICDSGGIRVASGFIWKHAEQVVTSAHVVLGCTKIIVHSDEAQDEVTATIERIHRGADLAILRIRPLRKTVPLTVQASSPAVFQVVYAFGYPLGIPKMNSTTLSVRLGGKTLRDIVPDSIRQDLSQAGIPSLETEILNLQGPLQEGSSGSPILNDAGQVIAIADGGLAFGAASASWAIPARYISELETHVGDFTKSPPKLAVLFSAELNGPAENVSCGGEKLTRVRKSSFPELVASADDGDKLEQLVITSYLKPSDFIFDIFQHAASGAALAVPVGVKFTSEGKLCKFISSDGRVEYLVQLTSYKDAFDLQGQSQDFESKLFGSGGWLGPDSTVSTGPKKRFDGLIVNRKGYTHTKNSAQPFDTNFYDAYLFETLAARNGILMMFVVIDHKSTPSMRIQEYECARKNRSDTECAQILPGYRAWVQAVLGTELTSFSVSSTGE